MKKYDTPESGRLLAQDNGLQLSQQLVRFSDGQCRAGHSNCEKTAR